MNAGGEDVMPKSFKSWFFCGQTARDGVAHGAYWCTEQQSSHFQITKGHRGSM